LAAGTSAVFTALALFKTFELVQNLKQNLQGAPNSYALGPVLAIIVAGPQDIFFAYGLQ